MTYYIIAAFAIALLLGFLVIPFNKRMAVRYGLVDHPDKRRKLHKNAIPMIGGISVFICALFSIAVLAFGFRDKVEILNPNNGMLLGLLISSFLILLLGVIDDRFNIRGRQKLLGQIIAASVLIYFGFQFDSIKVYGREYDLKIFSVVVVYFWILIGINSVNLLDGADGFATTIGLLMSLALCVMAFHLGKYEDAVICAAMAGALLAFMCFNFPPASAYLGDAGSMLIGLFIAAMAIKTSAKEAATYAFLAPIALLAIPMFDTLAAVVRRRLTGRSIYTVDRGHLHHALMGKGFGPRKALLMFFAMCLMTAIGGTMSLIYREAEFAILSIMAVGVFLIVGRVFGFAEYQLISSRSKSVIRSFFVMPESGGSGHDTSVQLQGERNWDQCWQVLREFAERNRLLGMTMDLNLPWIHESFHATYTSTDRKAKKSDEKWSFELPLLVGDRLIGRIEMEADARYCDFSSVLLELKAILDSLDVYFTKTIDNTKPPEVKKTTVDAEQSQAERQSLEFDDARSGDERAIDIG